jgi:hypothetical protein
MVLPGCHCAVLGQGHPLDGSYLSHHEAWFPIIDRWLDHGDLPPFV